MPIYKQWEICPGRLAAIWKIEEPLSFFEELTGIESKINNEKRRIEHLASRFLLKYLKPDFPLHLITIDEHRKPRLPNSAFFFSISHSFPYIAVVIDQFFEVGIDIQTWNDRIDKIQHKYLSKEEQAMIGKDPKLLTLAWCAKESVYKWHGKMGIEFIEELPIVSIAHNSNYDISINVKLNNIPQTIFIENILDADFACTFITNVQDLTV